MIDTHPLSEHPSEPFGNLRSQRNLRQQIEHLPSLPDGFFNQMDVDFRLAAGRHTLQQADVLLGKTLHHLVVCTLLCHTQRVRLHQLYVVLWPTFHLLLIYFQNSLLYQSVEDGLRCLCLLEQPAFRYLFLTVLSQEA